MVLAIQQQIEERRDIEGQAQQSQHVIVIFQELSLVSLMAICRDPGEHLTLVVATHQVAWHGMFQGMECFGMECVGK